MIKNLLQEMFILKSRGYYKQAIEILYKLLEYTESPEESIEILYELAEIYFFSANLERAKHYIDKLLDLNPHHTEGLRLKIKFSSNLTERIKIAHNLYKLTNKPEDLKLYLALLNRDGNYSEVTSYSNTSFEPFCCQEIAEAYFNLKEYEKAQKLLINQELLTEACESLLAKICYTINNEDALLKLRNKLGNSKNTEVCKYKIGLEFNLMNYSNVVHSAENLNVFNDFNLLYVIALANYYKRNFVLAKKYLNMLIEQSYEPKYRFALAMSYIKSNQTTQAIEAIKNDTAYLKLLTIILNEKSLPTKVIAKEFLSKIEILKTDEFTLFEVLDLCFKRNMLDVIKDLLKLANKSANIKYDYYSIKLLIKEGRYEQAEQNLNNYTDKDEFTMLYAELLELKNDLESLETLLNRRQSYESNEFEQCCYYYAKIFESKGEYLRAIDVAQKGLDFVTNYTEKYYLLLYNLYKKTGDMQTAVDALEKAAKYNPELRPKLIQEAALL